MKKSILFGALAFFVVSAMSIQDVNAQNEEKAKAKKIESVSEKQEKAAPAKVVQEPVKKDNCCAEKKVSAEKKSDCCADKKVAEKKDSKECCADKKMKEEKKNVKAEGKRVRPKDATKPDTKRTKKASVKSSKTEN